MVRKTLNIKVFNSFNRFSNILKVEKQALFIHFKFT